jgi:signal transduction histidine kinase
MGTGLSLAIAKAVIEAHGGKISIASVPDKGTTVDLRLAQPVEYKLRPFAGRLRL